MYPEILSELPVYENYIGFSDKPSYNLPIIHLQCVLWNIGLLLHKKATHEVKGHPDQTFLLRVYHARSEFKTRPGLKSATICMQNESQNQSIYIRTASF